MRGCVLHGQACPANQRELADRQEEQEEGKECDEKLDVDDPRRIREDTSRSAPVVEGNYSTRSHGIHPEKR